MTSPEESGKTYMDHIAASPLREGVLEVMLPLLRQGFGNPQSVHARGQAAAEVLDGSREQVASLVAAEPAEIVFTATGSEANNLAVKGIARARKKKSNRVIVSAVEHHSVLNACKALEDEGFELVVLPVDRNGSVAAENLEEALAEGAALVSIIHASTEIGTIEPVEELSAVCRERNIPMHTDAWGSAGIIGVEAGRLGVSAMTIAGQNFGGPPGAAALYIRRGTPIRPIIHGGVQERNLRAGQENIPAIAGMGEAARLAALETGEIAARLVPLRDALISRVTSEIEDAILTGHPGKRLPNHASFCFRFVEGEGLLLILDMSGIMAASGSACTSKSLKASHVLEAIGVDAATAQGSIVFTLGRENRPEAVDRVVSVLGPAVSRLREMSPLFRRKEDGPIQ